MTQAGELHAISPSRPYNGITDEICCLTVAQDLTHVGAEPDETEEFEIVRLTPSQIDEHIRMGLIWEGMTIAAWAIARPGIEFRSRSCGA